MFYHIVPAAGRYWYIPSIGVSLLTVVSVAWLSKAISDWVPRIPETFISSILFAILFFHYFSLLQYYTHEYQVAGERSRLIQEKLGNIVNDSDGLVFVRGQPAFQRDINGRPVAQIFHWGLSDAVLSPFLTNEKPVYPLLKHKQGDLIPGIAQLENA